MTMPFWAMTSERVASRSGATLIRINPREAQVPHGHIGIAANALVRLGVNLLKPLVIATHHRRLDATRVAVVAGMGI